LKTLYGLLGEKLGHSISPSIHSLIFKELNIDAYYHLFEIEKDNLKNAVHSLKTLGAGGVNVTIPYKITIMDYLDSISREATEIGSVNTIVIKDYKTIGYNTDYFGFGMLLKKNNIEVTNKNVVVLGSGGSSKAVLQYFLNNGAKSIQVVSRDINKINSMDYFKKFRLISYSELKSLKDVDIIVNTTPCGMYPNVDGCAVEEDILSKFSAAVDLIYNPKETLFLKHAKKSGAKAVNGLYMLVGQAVAAEELWNDVNFSRAVVDNIYDTLNY
jgi:shikimate dehydrogenase